MAMNPATPTDPAHDVLRSEREPLRAFFSPRNVALIGATDKPGSVGRTMLWNLINSPFGGTVFPVNPNRKHVLGVKAYSEIDSVPDPVDLAVIVTPAASVPALIRQWHIEGQSDLARQTRLWQPEAVVSADQFQVGFEFKFGQRHVRAFCRQAAGSGAKLGPLIEC